MYSLYNENGYLSDIGNVEVVNALNGIAKEMKLKELVLFFDQGFSLNAEALAKEIEGVDFGFSYLNDIVIDDILPKIDKTSKILILSGDVE